MLAVNVSGEDITIFLAVLTFLVLAFTTGRSVRRDQIKQKRQLEGREKIALEEIAADAKAGRELAEVAVMALEGRPATNLEPDPPPGLVQQVTTMGKVVESHGEVLKRLEPNGGDTNNTGDLVYKIADQLGVTDSDPSCVKPGAGCVTSGTAPMTFDGLVYLLIAAMIVITFLNSQSAKNSAAAAKSTSALAVQQSNNHHAETSHQNSIQIQQQREISATQAASLALQREVVFLQTITAQQETEIERVTAAHTGDIQQNSALLAQVQQGIQVVNSTGKEIDTTLNALAARVNAECMAIQKLQPLFKCQPILTSP